MIILLVRAGTAEHTVGSWADAPGRTPGDATIRVMSVERALLARDVPAATWIMADLERYGPGERRFADELSNVLRDAGSRVLNDPIGSPSRHELLTRLHEVGLADFRSHTLAERDHIRRWPVFLRMAHEHYVSSPTLLHDRAAVDAAVDRTRRVGRRPDDFLLVEHRDTRRPDGMYAKYAAYRIGDRIIPEHLTFSDDWMIKWVAATSPDQIRAERDYLTDCDHLGALREVFEVAGIDYGRVDYAIEDGRPVVWEINTNPVLADPWNIYPVEIHENRLLALEGLRAAFRAIDVPDDAGSVDLGDIDLPTRLRAMRDSAAYAARFGAPRWLRRQLRR